MDGWVDGWIEALKFRCSGKSISIWVVLYIRAISGSPHFKGAVIFGYPKWASVFRELPI